MDWAQAKDLLLTAAAGGVVWYAREVAGSIQELNIKIAVILEKIEGHEDRIKRLEDRS